MLTIVTDSDCFSPPKIIAQKHFLISLKTGYGCKTEWWVVEYRWE